MKNIIITGVSRGIGKALAEKFLSEGWFVIGTSTDGEHNLQNEKLVVYALDLSKPTDIEHCAQQIQESGKEVDVLINNAGMYDDRDSGPEINIDVLRKTLEVNLIGPIDFTQRILNLIKTDGHIINVSSRQGSMDYASNPGDPAYRISKSGVNMFTRILSFYVKDKGIIVSAVHPGSVQTDMGMADAPMTPAEAADDLYKLAISKPETGQFWFKGEKFPW